VPKDPESFRFYRPITSVPPDIVSINLRFILSSLGSMEDARVYFSLKINELVVAYWFKEEREI